MIKSIYRIPCSSRNYHQRSKREQVIMFRLRTGHNRLNALIWTNPFCSFHSPAVPVERLTRQLNTCSRCVKAEGERLADATEHPGTTVWPSGYASDNSTVHCRDWPTSVISDREEDPLHRYSKTL
jgi:hypothetical protein